MRHQHPGCGTDLALPTPDRHAAYLPQSGRQHNAPHQGNGAPQTTPEGRKYLVTPPPPGNTVQGGLTYTFQLSPSRSTFRVMGCGSHNRCMPRSSGNFVWLQVKLGRCHTNVPYCVKANPPDLELPAHSSQARGKTPMQCLPPS